MWIMHDKVYADQFSREVQIQVSRIGNGRIVICWNVVMKHLQAHAPRQHVLGQMEPRPKVVLTDRTIRVDSLDLESHLRTYLINRYNVILFVMRRFIDVYFIRSFI